MTRTDEFINLALPLKPSRISTFGVFSDFSDELYRFGFIAWLARVVWGNDHLDLHSHDVTTAFH